VSNGVSFLEKMMIRLGFHEDFVALLMACVHSVTYKVRFNNQEIEKFVPPFTLFVLTLCRRALKSSGS
jgi:hypothetical protein